MNLPSPSDSEAEESPEAPRMTQKKRQQQQDGRVAGQQYGKGSNKKRTLTALHSSDSSQDEEGDADARLGARTFDFGGAGSSDDEGAAPLPPLAASSDEEEEMPR